MKKLFRVMALCLLAAAIAFSTREARSFGAPGDVNNTFWSWGGGGTSTLAQNGATAAWTNGAIVIVPDTTNALEGLANITALPATPYTFRVYVDLAAFGVTATTGNACFLGLRETSTGKVVTVDLSYTNTQSGVSAQGGFLIHSRNNTSHTPASPIAGSQAYNTNEGYLQIQNDGTNIKTFFSPSGGANSFTQVMSETIATGFTTAPDQLVIGALGVGGGKTTCEFDFLRRVQ